MVLPLKKQAYVSPEEFLEIRRTSDVPTEYMDGEIVAMAGASKAHGQVVSAVDRLIGNALVDGPCEVSSTISVEAPRSYLIPDLVVYCDGGDFTPKDDVLRNPILIVEVLSTSTEDYDLGRKWMRYQQIASLKHYVLIAQDTPSVAVYTREPGGGWHYDVATGRDGIAVLSYLDLSIALSEIYKRVEFPEASI